MGSIDIENSFTLPSLAISFVIAIIGVLIWCLFWRILIRWNRNALFCYWFPTIMLIAACLMVLAAKSANSTPILGSTLMAVAYFYILINFPVLICVCGLCLALINRLYPHEIPIWTRMAFAGTLFWLIWHLFWRFMRMRTVNMKTPSTLNLEGPDPSVDGIHSGPDPAGKQ
jgi:hypothetical protein